MLCAFSSFLEFTKSVKELDHIFQSSSQEPDLRSQVLVFQATVPTEPDDSLTIRDTDDWDETILRFEESQLKHISSNSHHSIYGFAIQKSKIEVVSHWKSLEELKESFPTIPDGFVQRIWQHQQHSWQSCFQILSSLLLSKEKILLDNCDFLLEGEYWPNIAESMGKQSHCSTPTKECSNDWTVVSLDTFLRSSPLDDWQVVKESLPAPAHLKSYRDVLLSFSPANQMENDEKESMLQVVTPPSSGTWKPVFRVESVSKTRKDRTYINSNLSFNEIFGLPPDLQLTDEEKAYFRRIQEEDDEMEWEACCNGKFASQVSVNLKRKASTTHLRPNTYDQKMKRIAMKMK